MNVVVKDVLSRLRRLFSRGSKNNRARLLVREILSIQIVSAALVGVLSVAGLYWGGQWVLQDNYSRWALQWTEELNELGSPLFLVDGGDAILRLESYVARYPEIDAVTYFAQDGSAKFQIGDERQGEAMFDLSAGARGRAIAAIGTPEPYLMRNGILNPQRFEILAPIWKESIAADGLFNFGAVAPELQAQTELLGFVKISLDFALFHDRLLNNMKYAALFLIFLLVAFGIFGRYILQKALASISDLQHPIKELAKGNLDVRFEPAQHQEIADIVEALETTASALSERDAELVRIANHDSMTGLINRRRFLEALREEITAITLGDHESALLFVDLDQFKYINDACGHSAGDRLICKVADELCRSVRRDDVVARFGGDEFAILLRNTDLSEARSVAKSILANMRRMAHVEQDQVFHVHCSIGLTVLSGDNLHPDDLINQADIACREAKLAGRNRSLVYTPSEQIEDPGSSGLGWMNSLRDALDNDKFELFFQPINRIATGETTHHEVLIRLRGEDGSLVLPDAFLPSAVRFGLMSEIDYWVIENASREYARQDEKHRDLKLSINLSANVFENDDLGNDVEKIFAKHEVDPQKIVFEITESLAIRRPSHVERHITALRDLGCEFALDDFGTGYSSFSYLQKLHFDYIKIDGAFVSNLLVSPVDQKMIRLTAEIGHEAGMQVIAEYVENAETLELLGELGVDHAQGFFVGRPANEPKYRSTPISLKSRRNKRGAR